MIQSYVYPTAAELKAVESDLLPVLTADDPVFDIFPEESKDTDLLIWEKKDRWAGTMQVRGINGSPPLIKRPGMKQFMQKPSYFGEGVVFDEAEITRRRQFATWNLPIDVSDLAMEAQNFLLSRQITAIKKMCWDLLVNGKVDVYDSAGVLHETYSFTQRTFVSAVPWSTPATATPLQDFRSVSQYANGYSVSLGSGAKAYMNQVTHNALMANTNPADLYGRRAEGYATFNAPLPIQELWRQNNLPEIVVHDKGWLQESTYTFTKFIPNGYVVVVGERPAGMALGAFRYTRNANNPGLAPGPYSQIIDNLGREIPRKLEYHRGFNGAALLYWPSAIVVMKVF